MPNKTVEVGGHNASASSTKSTSTTTKRPKSGTVTVPPLPQNFTLPSKIQAALKVLDSDLEAGEITEKVSVGITVYQPGLASTVSFFSMALLLCLAGLREIQVSADNAILERLSASRRQDCCQRDC